MPRLSILTSLTWKQYALIAALVLGGAWFALSGRSAGIGDTVTVVPGDFLEQITVAGEVKAAQEVELGFEQSGRVSAVYASVGQIVSAGSALASLSSAELSASVLQKQAALEIQQAKLDGLKAGAQPADIAASQAAVDKAQQDLVNMYASISDTLSDGFAKGTDAVQTQLNGFFSNADTNNPQLTYTTSDSQSATDAATLRVKSRAELSAWSIELASISPASQSAILEAALPKGLAHLSIIRTLVQDVIKTLNSETNLSATTLATYKTSAADALSEVNTAITDLNDISQDIASQKIAVAQLQAQLEFKRAGSTAHDIAAQQASVNSAAADVASAQAQLAKSTLRAPFSGTVTKMDAKVGQVVSPDAAVVSLMSNGIFQIETFIPEVAIAQVEVGDQASTTLDAYGPDAVFSTHVVAIDPAQTMKNGVATYKTTLQFDAADSRIRPGMTANAIITTSLVRDALSVPLGAVFQKGSVSYVQVQQGKEVMNREITLAPSATALGNVRVLTGLQSGDIVLLAPDTSL